MSESLRSLPGTGGASTTDPQRSKIHATLSGATERFPPPDASQRFTPSHPAKLHPLLSIYSAESTTHPSWPCGQASPHRRPGQKERRGATKNPADRTGLRVEIGYPCAGRARGSEHPRWAGSRPEATPVIDPQLPRVPASLVSARAPVSQRALPPARADPLAGECRFVLPDHHLDCLAGWAVPGRAD